MIFESHAHYDDEAFDEDRDVLLKSLKGNGIEYVINVGASIESTKSTIELTDRYDFIYGAIGVHPNETEPLTEDFLQFMKSQLQTNNKIVAVGEIGLDYNWEEPARDFQKKWFIRQLELAKETDSPVIIHSRDAAKDTADIMLTDYKELNGVIHCFSYTKEMAKQYLDNGFYLGIGGVVTFKNAIKVKETVQYAPLDRILLETDCPYLAPVPNRGNRNSSLNIPYIAEEIARIKGIDVQEVIDVTNKNAKRLFFADGK